MGNILQVKGLCKRFAGVRALDAVDFSVRHGEVHALMGENGAGKSTLIKILTGIYEADGGDITFDGKPCHFKNAQAAQQAGISTIYQELNMMPYLTVSENIFVGRYPKTKSGINWKNMHESAQKLVDDIQVDIDVTKPLNTYGTAKQQIISILRAVSMNSKMIIMDEPTSSLDSNEVEILFGIMDRLKAEGIAIIFISHRLDEVYSKCDRITVLKDGRYIGTWNKSELTQYELLGKMLGRKDLDMGKAKVERDLSGADNIIDVKKLSRPPFVNGVSFSIRRGEIVGLAGLLGSGRTEVARILFGCDTPDSGEVWLEGKRLSVKTPAAAVANGMAFCTENRREEGIFPQVSVENNIALCSLSSLSKAGFIRRKARRSLSEQYIQKLNIKTTGGGQLIKNLSGGNQQKTILARWLATDPKLIILDEPTRGIDVGAKAEIERLIAEFSGRGISVLFISSEIPELVRNCDRILVLRDGRIMGELHGDDISEDNIMWIIAHQKPLSEKKEGE